jgi:two-component system, OmpR family, response regulator BaeR
VIPFVRENAPDLILLDILLPGMNGIEVCRGIRTFSTVPIIIITACIEENDRIRGIDLGADDYICKPFSSREVVARIKAILRRVSPMQQENVLKVGAIELYEDSRRLMVNGRELRLTPIEYSLIKVMMMRPKRIFSRSELVHHAQGYDFEGYNRTIDTHVKNLRRKIAAVLQDQEIIHSVYGVGYKVSDKKP